MSKPVAVWFELPATDLDRAQAFYEAVTARPMPREKTPDGTKELAKFLAAPDDERAQGCVIKGEPFRPSPEGTLVYLNGGSDLAEPLSRVVAAGGRILLPKTSIGPHGFIALFQDSEGNRVGLHSEK